MNGESVFEVRGLSKRFGALSAMNDVTLGLRRGERRALIGPNGAGKTTFVGLVSGVLKPDAGRIFLLGRDITLEQPHHIVRHGLVRTFQISNLFRSLTVLENVFLAASERLRRSRRIWHVAAKDAEIRAAAEDAIAQVGLGDDRHRRIAEIAYGRQRLVEIAIALSLRPKVLVLDEPAAGIPRDQAARLLDVLDRLPREIAILMIEHDMQVVRRFAETVTLLVGGSVALAGSTQEVMGSEEARRIYLGQSGHARFHAETLGA